MHAETEPGVAEVADGNLPAAAPLIARVGAALLDMLVAFAIVLVCAWAFLYFSGPTTRSQPLPGTVAAVMIGLVWLYLTGMSAAGGTLGLRATRLRVYRAGQATPPGLTRAAIRGLVLIGIGWLAVQVPPVLLTVLLVGYFLLALLIPGSRLPHDLMSGTVVGRAARPGGRAQATAVRRERPALDPGQASTLLADLGELRERSARHLHPASVPLIVLGLTAAAGGGAAWLEEGSLNYLSWLYWVLTGPASLLVTAWWYRRLRLREGAGTGGRGMITIAILVGCAALAGALFFLGGPVTAAGFCAIAWIKRSRALAIGAVVFGVVAGLEQPFHALSYGITNADPSLPGAALIAQHGTTMVLVLLGACLLAAGGVMLSRERAR